MSSSNKQETSNDDNANTKKRTFLSLFDLDSSTFTLPLSIAKHSDEREQQINTNQNEIIDKRYQKTSITDLYEICKKDPILKYKLAIDSSFPCFNFIKDYESVISGHPMNIHNNNNNNNESNEIFTSIVEWKNSCLLFCYPTPEYKQFNENIIQKSIDGLNFSSQDWINVNVEAHPNDAMTIVQQKMIEWQEAIQSALYNIQYTTFDHFYVISDWNRKISDEAIEFHPSALFHKINNEFKCLMTGVSESFIKSLVSFKVNPIILSIAEKNQTLNDFESYKHRSTSGILNEIGRGKNILIKGKYEIRVVVHFLIHNVLQIKKRNIKVDLPFIISVDPFTNSKATFPKLKYLGGPKLYDKNDKSPYRHEVLGFCTIKCIESLISLLIKYSSQVFDRYHSLSKFNVTIDMIEIPANMKKLENSQPIESNVRSDSLGLKSPFVFFSVPIEEYEGDVYSDTEDLDEDFDVIHVNDIVTSDIPASQWLDKVRLVEEMKYFNVSIFSHVRYEPFSYDETCPFVGHVKEIRWVSHLTGQEYHREEALSYCLQNVDTLITS